MCGCFGNIILYYIILYYIILYYIILYYIILYYIIIVWDHRHICGPSLTKRRYAAHKIKKEILLLIRFVIYIHRKNSYVLSLFHFNEHSQLLDYSSN